MNELILPGKIRKHKDLRYFDTPSGHTVVVLPTCTVPLEHLIQENWNEKQQEKRLGHSRIVYRISQLKNGLELPPEQQLWVKHPERKFPEHGKWLWDNFSIKMKVKPGNNLVEAQAKWEARYLIGLINGKLSAEEPQAIILHKDGSKSLIVKNKKNILHTITNPEKRSEIDMKYNQMVVDESTELGAKPRDYLSLHNALVDEKGNISIMDVNRWDWIQPPHLQLKGKPLYDSTKFNERLIKELNKLRAQIKNK